MGSLDLLVLLEATHLYSCIHINFLSFKGALLLAGYYAIPEVTVYFNKNLYRGNRVTKMSTDAFNAFGCPNFEPLVETGVSVKIHWDRIFKPVQMKPFSCWSKVNFSKF